ncbi:MAG: hypothetical protein N2Z76_08140, partial [Treponemataceae bacterium]|nr:hypothetical protein [Treponemataceae bacterium]
IVVDIPAPNPPIVNGTTPTNNTRPTWSWTSGGGGSGTGQYRYQLNSTSGVWVETTTTSYKPSSDLADGSHTLYVQERSIGGKWSGSGAKTIVVDTVPPNAPSVSGTTPTTNRKPTWSWTSGGGGNGQFRYYLHSPLTPEGYSNWTTATSYTHTTELADGWYTITVEEKDDAGNISPIAVKSIRVDAPPNPPVFTGPETVTLSQTPTWSWQSGGFGSGIFNYFWNGTWSGETSATSYTPSTLADGSYTLKVKEKDAGGEWSSESSRTVVVTPVIPYNGQTLVSTIGFTFKWRPGEPLSIYEVQLLENGSWVTKTSTTKTSYSYSVTSDTTYRWRVKVVKPSVSYIPNENGATFTTGK